MLSERARHYLATLKREAPVPTRELERVLKEQGATCFPAWLDFHERYAGYVEPIGLEMAVWGLVHQRPRWMKALRVAINPSYESRADSFVTCADVHPSYTYHLGDTGFFRELAAESFDVKVERNAVQAAFVTKPGPKPRTWTHRRDEAFLERVRRETSVVEEASDVNYQVRVGDRLFAVQETSTGRLIDAITRDG